MKPVHLPGTSTSSSWNRPTSTPSASSCKIKTKHICFCPENKEVTLESMAKKFCYLSRSVTLLKNAFQAHSEEVSSLLLAKTKTPLKDAGNEKNEEEMGQDVTEILTRFPIRDLDELQKFNDDIHLSTDYKKNVVSALLHLGKKSSPSRFITSALRKIVGAEILGSGRLSWKGHQRGGVRKESFSGSPLCEALMNATRNIWKGLNETVMEKTISGFLSQTKTKLKNVSLEINPAA
ncbi:uncharacterized protein LOC128990793 [Macrosteles quadrilineatus]|uniref:uncharacterized protein LOC128983349 n=1 Tax=Macrosteles quadrilineatus TaxID=74068 RepID=UPI0023E33F8C|nr:uncharacterized protein LOC128983349 [Macrosteles quadrilineatus]XP_054258581.1 uncharacterized protein LOC128983349 [Macrosteles quadrilineatus]XP_054269347.1 uncharacterized protein LOC128990793 [Macrosteles quadrilineatus]XP_054269348.1 uncharacterized protein LOC128990793 [Macrosteles quadrilineatus]